tara:strand:- start:3641 stop:3856 length:216 start_codon:yes stop_codon:yes gene_type:complete
MHYIEDEQGDVVDILPYCSDHCHREGEGTDYKGWNGGFRLIHIKVIFIQKYDQECANCGDLIPGLETLDAA